MIEHLQEEELQLYLDRQLVERERQDHLRGCPLCQERLREYQLLYEGLAAGPAWSPSPAMAPRVMRRIRRESFGGIYANLVNILYIIGGTIAALSFALPRMRTENYIESARRYQPPDVGISWEWLEQLNFLPQIGALFKSLQLPYGSLLMVCGVLLLVALADQVITHTRGKVTPHGR